MGYVAKMQLQLILQHSFEGSSRCKCIYIHTSYMYMYYDSNCQDYLFKSSTSTKLKQKIKTGIQKIHVLNLQLYSHL